MPLVPAKCPECGGLVEVDNEKRAGLCQHCGQPFVIEDAIQTFNTYYQTTNNYNTTHNYGDGTVVNIYEDTNKDFIIEAGVLKEYHGASVDVVIPDGVVEIESGSFENLNIKSVVIPGSVENMGADIYGASAFSGCTSLLSVTILSGVTSIGQRAFSGCTNLTSVTIPASVTSIDAWVFAGCCNLASVTIPDSVTSIDASAFSGCTNLTSVTIPNSVTSIGASAFSGCTNLTSVTIPNSVTSIDAWAFAGCCNLASVTIPDSVTSIGAGAFSGCTNLTSIIIDENNKYYSSTNGVLFNKNRASIICYPTVACKYVIPTSVTSVGAGAFSGCTKLASITIPDSVINIGKCAFRNCTSLTSVTIPDSVTSIDAWAFDGCCNLASVIIPDNISLQDSSFDTHTVVLRKTEHAKKQAEEQANCWKGQGLCQYCGGKFKYGFLKGAKCTGCGRNKDY